MILLKNCVLKGYAAIICYGPVHEHEFMKSESQLLSYSNFKVESMRKTHYSGRYILNAHTRASSEVFRKLRFKGICCYYLL